MKYADKIPYGFILDHLDGVDLTIKPMFGCYGLYANGRFCLFLMDREAPFNKGRHGPQDNGVYLAATSENAESLKAVFPDADIRFLKEGKAWMFISEQLERFEAYIVVACEMIKGRDSRIGR